MADMKLVLARREGNHHVALQGSFDESLAAPLAKHRAKLGKAHVVFDCAGITQINSRGFRLWVDFLRDLNRESTFEFVSCPSTFIEFANLMPTLAFARCIVSFAVPFQCEACRRKLAPVFTVENSSPERDFDLLACPECNGTMRAEVDAANYLEFMGGPR